jgi:flagellar biosynthetic protein FlhB
MAEDQEQEDRTEDPTLRRLEQAIERGDVARSMEVNTWFVLAGATLALLAAGGQAFSDMTLALQGFLAHAHAVPMDGAGPMAVTAKALLAVLGAVAVPFALIVVFGLAGGLVQHRLLFTTEPLTPQLSRISPVSGFKRIFGKEAFVQFTKGLLKLAVVGLVMWMVLWPDRYKLESFAGMDVLALLPATRDEALKLMGGVLAIYAFIAGADYLYQRFTWFNRQRMTKQELKQEYKETEGNPEVKAKLRQIRARAAKQRMMTKVPQATVVVMNPTHFAVALRYESGMAAPVCVAKGQDAIALRIRDVAEENSVPVVENPPLARALYKAVDLDQEIPVEHYKAVAEVIGYVMRFRRRAS